MILRREGNSAPCFLLSGSIPEMGIIAGHGRPSGSIRGRFLEGAMLNPPSVLGATLKPFQKLLHLLAVLFARLAS